jgi:hypothetical protein
MVFSRKIYNPGKKRATNSKCLRKNKKPKIFYPAKLSYRDEKERKMSPDKQR